jgi:hypothetical protein
MTREKTPQQKAVRSILRELAPLRGERKMQDGDDLVLFVSLKRTPVLQSYRINPAGEITDRRSYKTRRNEGVRIRAAHYHWDAIRTPGYVGARLPLFANVTEAVRFLEDFPMIPTDEPALAHLAYVPVHSIGGLGTVTETDVFARYDRKGNRAS